MTPRANNKDYIALHVSNCRRGG